MSNGGFMRFLVWVTGILGAVGLLLYLLVFDVWVVPQGTDPMFKASVLPTLVPEDKILVRRGSVPRFGELARCASPSKAGELVVGRVFGEPGDKVDIADAVITTNGKGMPARHGCPPVVVAHPVSDNLVTMNCGVVETGAFNYSFLASPTMSAGQFSARVEAGKLFLVSDNRTMHMDSRDFGQVDASTCEHVMFRLWGEHYSDGSRRFTVVW